MSIEELQVLSTKIDTLSGTVTTMSGVVIELSNDVARMDERIKAMHAPGAAAMCAVHEHRMDDLEGDMEDLEGDVVKVSAALGKQNLVAMTLGAVAAGIVLAIKYALGVKGGAS